MALTYGLGLIRVEFLGVQFRLTAMALKIFHTFFHEKDLEITKNLISYNKQLLLDNSSDNVSPLEFAVKTLDYEKVAIIVDSFIEYHCPKLHLVINHPDHWEILIYSGLIFQSFL